ncbi:MAG: sensor histidine kinase [Cyanobacteria bacterium P01_A01_bin.105]
MSRAIRFQNHPFRFLLYLEWGLLAIALLGLLTPARPLLDGGPPGLRLAPPSPWLQFICIVVFGSLGLRLPTGSMALRFGHTALQTLLISITGVVALASGRLFPSMHLVLVIRSCFMYDLVGRLVVSSLSLILFSWTLQLRLRMVLTVLPPRPARLMRQVLPNLQLNTLFLFALTLAFVVLLVNALLTERQSQAKLRHANEQLQQSAKEIERLAMDQERSRIARDIHDSLGHSLTALNIQLEGALKLADRDPPKARTFLTEAKHMGSVALQEVRQSVAALRGEPLKGIALADGIAELVDNFQKASGITPTVDLALPATLSEPARLALYRIVQEGLTNILKHAQPQTVKLAIATHAQRVMLTLTDDGRGFEPTLLSTGYGLRGMRERAEALGGSFTIQSQPSCGSSLQVSLPLGQEA